MIRWSSEESLEMCMSVEGTCGTSGRCSDIWQRASAEETVEASFKSGGYVNMWLLTDLEACFDGFPSKELC